MTKKQTISEKFLSKFRVRVIKKESDSRNSLCGEPMQIDDEGNEYFDIPAHQAEYQSKIHPHYEFSEEFIPDAKSEIAKEKTEVIKKPRGNPNWRKDKANPIVKSNDFVAMGSEEVGTAPWEEDEDAKD